MSRALRVMRILWAAIIASTVVFLVVLLRVGPRSASSPEPVVAYALVSVAAVIGVLSFVLPARAYTQAARARALPGDTDARRIALVLYMTPFILSLALSEAVALNGFALGFLGFGLTWSVPLFVASWMLLLVRFPTERAILSRFSRATGAQVPPDEARGIDIRY